MIAPGIVFIDSGDLRWIVSKTRRHFYSLKCKDPATGSIFRQGHSGSQTQNIIRITYDLRKVRNRKHVMDGEATEHPIHVWMKGYLSIPE